MRLSTTSLMLALCATSQPVFADLTLLYQDEHREVSELESPNHGIHSCDMEVSSENGVVFTFSFFRKNAILLNFGTTDWIGQFEDGPVTFFLDFDGNELHVDGWSRSISYNVEFIDPDFILKLVEELSLTTHLTLRDSEKTDLAVFPMGGLKDGWIAMSECWNRLPN